MRTSGEILRFSPFWNLCGENGKLKIDRKNKIRLSPDKSRSCARPSIFAQIGSNARSIQHSFGCTVQAEVFFHLFIDQCCRTKRSQAQPGRNQTKCLTKMSGFEQHDTVRARETI